MIITGMAHYESVCKKKLVEWYRKNRPGVEWQMVQACANIEARKQIGRGKYHKISTEKGGTKQYGLDEIEKS